MTTTPPLELCCPSLFALTQPTLSSGGKRLLLAGCVTAGLRGVDDPRRRPPGL